MQPLQGDDPRRVGRYELLGRLGSGGMGQVYLGRSPGNRLVAVKTVHRGFAADREFRQRFAREVTAARRVSGAFTAPVLDADPDADLPWLVTAYISGPTLEAVVDGHGPLPETSVRVLAAALAEALLDIHRNGLVHRDLKPTNVLLAEDGPRVLDFGIAYAADASAITATGAAIGTPGYWSPEQVEGRALDPRSDVFSLGALLVFASTGRPPFGHGTPLVLLRRVVDTEADLAGVPDGLRPVLAACLAKDPVARPQVSWLLELSRDVPPQSSWLPPSAVTMITEQRTAAPVRPSPAAATLRMSPDDVRRKEFGRPGFARRGYDVDDVDAFLDRVEATLRALLNGRRDLAQVTATDVHNVVFQDAGRGRGYDETEVDDFLDEIAAELARHGLG